MIPPPPPIHHRRSGLFAGDQKKNAKVWSVSTGLLICTLPCNDFVKRVNLSGDGAILATGSGDTCNIWDLKSGMLIFTEAKGGRLKLASVSAPCVSTPC